MKILLDTSFLLELLKYKISIQQFYDIAREKPEFFVTEGTIRELQSLARNKGKKGVNAKISLMFLQKQKVKVIPNNKTVDEALIELSRDYLIATLDLKLAKKLKQLGATVITLKGKKKIDYY